MTCKYCQIVSQQETATPIRNKADKPENAHMKREGRYAFHEISCMAPISAPVKIKNCI